MTTTNRIDKIKAYKEQNDNKALQQQNELNEHREELEKRIYDLADRIEELITVANACIQNGIEISNSDFRDKGYDYHHFAADGIYHRVGFIFNEYWDEKTEYIGIKNGGACGNIDLRVSINGTPIGIDNSQVMINGRFVDKKQPCQPRIRDMEKFLAQFDEFEQKFYAYVDKVTENI